MHFKFVLLFHQPILGAFIHIIQTQQTYHYKYKHISNMEEYEREKETDEISDTDVAMEKKTAMETRRKKKQRRKRRTAKMEWVGIQWSECFEEWWYMGEGESQREDINVQSKRYNRRIIIPVQTCISDDIQNEATDERSNDSTFPTITEYNGVTESHICPMHMIER
ncbi:hypothetical protein AB6A40_001465 [Gnathostoma spinigerum]|uniref:Uncharacterized protein n=1 Tax=Gnathostoma spinigerum TaxID=75299 RepID=A0ABD6EBH0_9BILA